MSTRLPRGADRTASELPCCSTGGTGIYSHSMSPAKQHPRMFTDEFAVPEERQSFLTSVKPKVELLFRVDFTIVGLLDPGGRGSKATRQIWVQLTGKKEDVWKAKEYVKGVCNPELQEMEKYPKDMHCIFVGAQKLFINCLIQDTSADVLVVEMGLLCICGGTEAVVMAQSQIQQFVKLFVENQSLPSKKEPLVKKAFKNFVESHADKYTMELLLLPSSLKEELLSLTKSTVQRHTGLEFQDTFDKVQSHPRCGNNASCIDSENPQEVERGKACTPVTELSNQILNAFIAEFEEDPPVESTAPKERQSCKRRSSGSEDRDTKRQFSLESKDSAYSVIKSGSPTFILSDEDSANTDGSVIVVDSNEAEDVSPETNYNCLVNFFKTMGYARELVVKVIEEMGQREEPLVLLKRIEEENQKLQGWEKKHPVSQAPSSSNKTLCEGSKKSVQSEVRSGKGKEKQSNILSDVKNCKPLNVCRQEEQRSDSLRVTKNISLCPRLKPLNAYQQEQQSDSLRATKNISLCPRMKPLNAYQQEQQSDSLRATKNISLCPRMKPLNAYQQEQQSDSLRATKNISLCPRMKAVITIGDDEDEKDIETDGSAVKPALRLVKENVTLKETDFISRGSSGKALFKPVPVESVIPLRSSAGCSSRQDTSPPPDKLSRCSSSSVFQAVPSRPPLQFIATMPSHEAAASVPAAKPQKPNASCVTGEKRFQESLKTKYKLNLENKPGRPDLKNVIIDGSNVAMGHGLHKYFSCRGIAIAVEFFWKYGHRHITVFVPQWRQRYDPLITEKHFLEELEELGILSYTPARMFCGQRIASHDDRFLLHLAEKLKLVVTNDNLREFVTESEAWKQIVKERLLQYTFVGDIFMIPDDPLGRFGPRLDEFMRRDLRRGPPRAQLGPPAAASTEPPQATGPGLQTPPLPAQSPNDPPRRSTADTEDARKHLYNIFPQQRQKIDQILSEHPHMRDLNSLSSLVLDLEGQHG
ncbi:NEDD4-binding protein 1-like isoform X1 [Acipenser oxyrinchus oxyrinchus]|uniref:NEDD4-binding protein 1 n=1 Tax=Acipenser oxyrinchus oxyrinchus TaxID=40147 RepID=A0AAD8D179_ACIOX|nr:NEDD4-binding protein 1-like isoform X1 [Acipenser oxyrinchus oxyrinchus]